MPSERAAARLETWRAAARRTVSAAWASSWLRAREERRGAGARCGRRQGRLQGFGPARRTVRACDSGAAARAGRHSARLHAATHPIANASRQVRLAPAATRASGTPPGTHRRARTIQVPPAAPPEHRGVPASRAPGLSMAIEQWQPHAGPFPARSIARRGSLSTTQSTCQWRAESATASRERHRGVITTTVAHGRRQRHAAVTHLATSRHPSPGATRSTHTTSPAAPDR